MELDRPLLLVAGAALVLLTLLDLVWTTVGAGGGRGPIANAVARVLSALGHAGAPSHRRLRITGVVIAVAVPVAWLVLTWAGFSLMFLADDQAVVSAASQQPSSALGRVAYAAGGLAGAGASLVAGSEAWELVNNVAAMVGLGLVTLALTYLFRLVTSVAFERTTSSQIAALGESPSDAVAAALATPDLGTFPLQVVTIAGRISQIAQDHLTLPMLQFFHSSDPDTSISLNVARYDEIISLLEHAVPADLEPTIRAGRSAVEDFERTLDLDDSDVEPPPPPPLDRLRAVRDDLPDDAGFAEDLEPAADRRRRLRAFVEQEAWSWDDVSATADPS